MLLLVCFRRQASIVVGIAPSVACCGMRERQSAMSRKIVKWRTRMRDVCFRTATIELTEDGLGQ